MKTLKYYKKNGYEFQIVERTGDIARSIGRKGKLENHEVLMVQSHQGRKIGETEYPPSEYPPSNEQWGSKGWTFSSEEQAKEKMEELANQSTTL